MSHRESFGMREPFGADDLAKAIRSMTFADLMKVACDLHGMSQTDGGQEIWDLREKHTWAEMLDAWAESKEYDGQFQNADVAKSAEEKTAAGG